MKYSISNFETKNKIKKPKLWKMDTSHISILDKFSNIKSIQIKSINKDIKINDQKFEFTFWNQDNTTSKIQKGFSTTHQYLRILFFYNIINLNKELINAKTNENIFENILDIKIKLNFYINREELFLKNLNRNRIFKNIELILNNAPSNSRVFQDAINIISTAEIFINWYYFSTNNDFYDSSKFFIYKQNYYKYFKKNRNDNLEGFKVELKAYFKMFDFFEFLFKYLNLQNNKEQIIINNNLKENKFVDNFDFDGLGRLGETVIDIYLQSEKNKYIWESKIDKYSPYDFLQYKQNNEKKFIEVKTPSKKYNDFHFHLSYNEKQFLEKEVEHYELLYVDKLYKSFDIILSDIITKKFTKETISSYIENEIIEIKSIKGEILNDDNVFSYKNKGYWVHRI